MSPQLCVRFCRDSLLPPNSPSSTAEQLNPSHILPSFVGLDWLFSRVSVDQPVASCFLQPLLPLESKSLFIGTPIGFLFPCLIGHAGLSVSSETIPCNSPGRRQTHDLAASAWPGLGNTGLHKVFVNRGGRG